MYRKTSEEIEYRYGFIGRILKNRVIKVLYVHNNNPFNEDSDVSDNKINNESMIIQQIRNKTTIARCDTSVKNNTIAGV